MYCSISDRNTNTFGGSPNRFDSKDPRLNNEVKLYQSNAGLKKSLVDSNISSRSYLNDNEKEIFENIKMHELNLADID